MGGVMLLLTFFATEVARPRRPSEATFCTAHAVEPKACSADSVTRPACGPEGEAALETGGVAFKAE